MVTNKTMKMRKTAIIALAASILCSCEHDIEREAHYNVTLDPENTYIAGTPVRFNIDGEIDNLLFYSGETGSRYIYKDRYTVPSEDVKAAVIDMDFQARYGNAGAMEIWVSKDFTGLSGEDGETDRQLIRSMVEGGMQGWSKLDYQEGASTKWSEQSFDLSEYVDNFCIAFHWCPTDPTATQRTYWINGELSLELEGTEPTKMDLSELAFKTVMMNEEIEDPYKKNAGNGSIILNNPNTAALIFQGVGGNALTYALDGWAISTPAPLNKVANDKPTVIKNIQNYLHTYEYTWTKPGTYKVTFVGTNESHLHSDSMVQEMSVTILEEMK